MYVCIYIYIYIHACLGRHGEGGRGEAPARRRRPWVAAACDGYK